MMIRLRRGLFEGDYPLSQLFGEHPEWYAPFGMKGHNGLDYAVPTGTKLISCISGTVIENAYDQTGYGKYIKIENDTCGVIYGHMKAQSTFKVGSTIKAGEVIGESGNTGNSTGSHLHFGVFPKPRNRNNGYAGYIDPFDKTLVEWVDTLDTPVANDEVSNLRKLVKELETSKEEYKTENKDLKQNIKDLKEEIEEKEKQYQVAKNLIESVTEQKQEAINKANEYSKEVLTLKDKLKNSLEDLVEAHNTINELKSVQGTNYTWGQVVSILKDFISRKLKGIKK